MKITTRCALALLLSVAPGVAMADVWEIYSYWSVDELYVIFNSISTMMTSVGFARLSKTTMLLVFCVSLLATAIYLKDHTVRWLISVMLLWGLVNLPVADVAIIDKTGTQPPKVVAHVPVFLAATASLITTASDWLTRSFEASFATVLDATTVASWQSLTFRDHDLGFGHRLIKDSQRMRIADPILQADMVYFTRDCINAGMAEGRLDFKRIYQGTEPFDTWAYITANVNPARMTTYHDSAQNVRVGYCDEVANGTLNVAQADGLTQRLDAGIAAAQAYYGQKYNKSDVTGAMFATHLQNAYGVMLNASMGASDIIKQNMFLNLHNDSKGAIGQMMGDPAAVTAAYAKAQAVAMTNSSYLTMANLAEGTMPRIRNLLEFIIYSIFPIVALYMLNAGHKSLPVFRGYLMALVQINLWPPLYAVLNFSMHSNTADSLIASTAMSGGLSIQTMGMVSGTLISDQAMMGYMVIFIPAIAAGLTKGGEMAISSVAQGWMAPMQKIGGQAGSGAALGNMSQGNVGMDNASANKVGISGSWSSPSSYESQTNSGWKTRFTGDGSSIMDGSGSVSNLGSFSMKTAQRQAASLQHQSEKSETAAAGEMRSYAETTAAGLQKMAAFEQGHGKGASSGTRDGVGWGAGSSQEATLAMKDVNQFAKDHQLSQKQAAELMLMAQADAKVGGKIPLTDTGASVSAAARLSGKSAAEAGQILKAAHQFNEEHGFSAKVDAATKAAHESSFDIKDESIRRGAESVRGSFDQGRQALTQASANYQQSQSYKEAAARTKENSETIDRVANDRFKGWLEGQDEITNPGKKLGGSGATRVLTDTNEAPKLWYAEKYQRDVQEPELLQQIKQPETSQDVKAAHQNNASNLKGHEQVAAQGGAWVEDTKNAAAKAGVAANSAVTSNVPQQAEAIRDSNTRAIEKGRSDTTNAGTPLRVEAEGRTQPGSQNLAGLATTNAVAQVTPDSASGAMMKKIPGIDMSVGTPGAAVAEASAARAADKHDINKQIIAASLTPKK